MAEASAPSPAGAVVPPVLDIDNLVVKFDRRGGWGRHAPALIAVDGVSLRIRAGETFGLVGESGSGKSTVGRAVVGLIQPSSGIVRLNGIMIAGGVIHLSAAQRLGIRRLVQMIFQDPAGSLNPRMRIGAIVAEPLIVHGLAKALPASLVTTLLGTTPVAPGLKGFVAGLLERCGIEADAVHRYPHEFSGGQRQRIAIARALALGPCLVVCDEPTSALDVSIQAQILNLLRDLQRNLGLSYLFISHDMAVIDHMCDHVAVMRGGKVVEQGPRERVLGAPEHEYTRALLAAVPRG